MPRMTERSKSRNERPLRYLFVEHVEIHITDVGPKSWQDT
jgi:hypothetical protein